jgi:asparagine N-glycosylation enzyme membrane subunit Stt3
MFLDDEEATARIRTRRLSGSLWVAVTALAACVLMMLALVGTASAQDISSLSQVVTPQLLLKTDAAGDQRLIFGALTLVFCVAAAGLWRLSFRGLAASQRTKADGRRIHHS